MKRVLGVAVGVFALLLSIGAVQAAEVNTSKGTMNLVFEFDGLSSLDVEGYRGSWGAGMRYFIQDGMALRPGARLAISSSDDNDSDTDDPSDTSFGLSAVLEKYRDVGIESLAPWFGVGGSFDTASYESGDLGLSPNKDLPKETLTQFTVFGAVGFQWAFAKGLTLGGEYQAGVSIGKDKLEDADGDTVYDYSYTDFGFNTAALFISVAL